MTEEIQSAPVRNSTASPDRGSLPIVVTVQPAPKKTDYLDILAKIMGIILPVVLYFATASFNHQQVDLQSLEHRQSIDEENRGRVMERLFNLGDASVTARLAAAKALRSYADMGRLDAVALPGLLPYLRAECDETTFRILKETTLAAAKNSWQTSTTPGTQHSELLNGIDAIVRSSECPKDTSSVSSSAPRVATVVAAPPRYMEVGCSATNSGVLDVPVPAILQDNQKVQSVSASITNIDNLKAQSATVLQYDNAMAKIQYMLVGVDRQIFGNCPGGGHGTIVTSFVIGPK